jgi:hypothetical protein
LFWLHKLAFLAFEGKKSPCGIGAQNIISTLIDLYYLNNLILSN